MQHFFKDLDHPILLRRHDITSFMMFMHQNVLDIFVSEQMLKVSVYTKVI